ncbi:MAG: hypothetical protein K0S53_1028 [Bacteroidetes bacterium]|jgi:hypothetical protein|nr:hypothetical protein [Bacteroidota bacterium]
MQFKKLILLFLIHISAGLIGQAPNDFAFVLSERAVNKVFIAIGEINGKSAYEVLGIVDGHYKWKVVNPKISFKPDSSDFTCDVKVEVGPFAYKSQVLGHVKIGYDNKMNQISIKIVDAVFELYTMVLKKKVHIKYIHLEEYFKDPFLFDGPKSFATDMSFTMPDSTVKQIYVQPSDCVMKVMKQVIKTSCDIVAQDKPFKKETKVTPPVQIESKEKNTTIKNTP